MKIQSLSDSWQESLLESLKDPLKIAGYIEAALEEKNPEPEFLLAVIKDVIDANKQMNHLSDEAIVRYDKLSKILANTGGDEIYALVELLNTLGFRVNIVPNINSPSLE